ncbi:MAG TPA: hypothetical protein VK622_10695 [Puia sp.]|nr:hypothetical protein [Puia sp.]
MHGRYHGQEECHLCELKNELIRGYADLNNRINGLHCNKLQQIELNQKAEKKLGLLNEYKNRQIDENRKISEKVDGLDEIINRIDHKFCFATNNLEDLVNKLQQSRDANSKNNKEIFERIKKLEDTANNICNALEKDRAHKIPHKCPVCDGVGKIKHPLNGLLMCKCESCEGKRIIWG